jgi:GTP-binding protein
MANQPPQVSFVHSAGRAAEFPSWETDEFCLLGRSNVGKSSFINHVFVRKGIARVSKTPGKTILANFYRLGDGSHWVDLPGYGYARRPHGEENRLGALIRCYCEGRTQLRGVIWLLDSRHPGLAADLEAYRWIVALGLPVLAVLTKCDKCSRTVLQKARRQHAACYAAGMEYVEYSTLKSGSRAAFWQAFSRWRGGLGGRHVA